MYGFVAFQLARRGFQGARQGAPDGQHLDREKLEMLEAIVRARSPGTMVMLVVTTLVFFIIAIATEYTLRFVVGTLAAIEYVPNEPSPGFELDGLLEEEELEDPERSGKEYNDASIPVDDEAAMESKATKRFPNVEERGLEDPGTTAGAIPVTSSLLGTLGHLRRSCGIWSFFRGFKGFVLWSVIFFGVGIPLEVILSSQPSWLASTLSLTLGSVIAAPLHCSWTHAIIRRGSASRAGHSVRYLPGVWSRHLVLPSIRFSVLTALCMEAALGITKTVMPRLPEWPFVVFMLLGFVAPLLFMVATSLLVLLPAIIALARIEASLLPEGADAVVPLDRLFAGRSAAWSSEEGWWRYVWVNLSPIGAWKTFDKETYWRMFKVYVRFGAVSLLLFALLVATLVLELYIVLHGHIRLIVLMILPI